MTLDENGIFFSDENGFPGDGDRELSDEKIDTLLDGVAARYAALTPAERDALRKSVDQVERDRALHAPRFDQLPLDGADAVAVPQLGFNSDHVSQMLLDANALWGHGCGDDKTLQAAAVEQATISAAKARAASIVDDAEAYAAKIIEDARQEAHDLRLIARKTLRDAHRDADLARDQIVRTRAIAGALLQEAQLHRDQAQRAWLQQPALTDFEAECASVPTAVSPNDFPKAVGVPESLVRVEGGHVWFSESVSRIADALIPLGDAGRRVAESYALATEIRRINLEKAMQDKEVKLTVLDQRRRESTTALRHMQKELGRADRSASALRECVVNMQRETVKPGLALAERRACIELTQHFTTMLVQHHSDLTGGVADVIDKVLNGSGAQDASSLPVLITNGVGSGKTRFVADNESGLIIEPSIEAIGS